ncbi:MAG: hypothetical protein DWQ06_05280 [Calditrichaeota bacterium]|nr:MAG: hypothetical protein DWQ06_05280 [Calditrichota bacterium]
MHKKIIVFLSLTFLLSCSEYSESQTSNLTAPQNLKINQLSETEVTLSWDYEYPNFKTIPEIQKFHSEFLGFKIERKTNELEFTEIVRLNGDVVTFNDSGLVGSNSYTYKISALTEANSVSSEPLKIAYEPFGYELGWTGNHQAGVRAGVFSPDNSSILTGSDKGEIKLWNSQTGEIRWQKKFPLISRSVRFSFDGTKVIVNSGERIIVLRTSNGTLLWEKSHSVETLLWEVFPSHDNTKVVSCGTDKFVRVWNLADGTLLWEHEHEKVVNTCEFSPDDSKVATGTGVGVQEGKVKVFDSENGNLLWEGEHGELVFSIAFSPDGTRFASTGHDSLVKVWDSENGNLFWEGQHQNLGFQVNFSHDGKKLTTASEDRHVRVWDVETGNEDWKAFQGEHVWSASFSSDGTKVVAGSFDNRFKVWKAKNGFTFWEGGTHDHLVFATSFNSDDSQILSTSYDAKLKVWNARKMWSVVE